MTTSDYIFINIFTSGFAFGLGYIYRLKQVGKQVMNDEIHKEHRQKMRDVLGKKSVPIPSEIERISNRFTVVFGQAMDALQDGYNEISGIGFGKSLEILIKDYSIYLHPAKRESIEKATLSNCIKEYLTDNALKDSSELATWLRNNETHYRRKWENKDVKDLVNLLTLIVTLIVSSEKKRELDARVAKAKESFNKNV